MAAASHEYPPLLFTTPADQPPDYWRTPRSAHSPLRESGSMSTRRSVTPPGSVHTDTTPPRPPPIMRLQDTLMTDAEGGGTPSPGPAAGGQPPQQQPPQAGAGTGVMRVESFPQPDDSWVTVYGFGPDDLPLVLREFQRCGDVLQWGTFGASPAANFTHIQFQTTYGAQRALLRSGEQLSPSLIVGVKPLEPRHRAVIEAWPGGGGGAASPSRMRGGGGGGGAVRPYRVDVSQAQALPQRSRTLVQKLSEFVLGV